MSAALHIVVATGNETVAQTHTDVSHMLGGRQEVSMCILLYTRTMGPTEGLYFDGDVSALRVLILYFFGGYFIGESPL